MFSTNHVLLCVSSLVSVRLLCPLLHHPYLPPQVLLAFTGKTARDLDTCWELCYLLLFFWSHHIFSSSPVHLELSSTPSSVIQLYWRQAGRLNVTPQPIGAWAHRLIKANLETTAQHRERSREGSNADEAFKRAQKIDIHAFRTYTRDGLRSDSNHQLEELNWKNISDLAASYYRLWKEESKSLWSNISIFSEILFSVCPRVFSVSSELTHVLLHCCFRSSVSVSRIEQVVPAWLCLTHMVSVSRAWQHPHCIPVVSASDGPPSVGSLTVWYMLHVIILHKISSVLPGLSSKKIFRLRVLF